MSYYRNCTQCGLNLDPGEYDCPQTTNADPVSTRDDVQDQVSDPAHLQDNNITAGRSMSNEKELLNTMEKMIPPCTTSESAAVAETPPIENFVECYSKLTPEERINTILFIEALLRGDHEMVKAMEREAREGIQ